MTYKGFRWMDWSFAILGVVVDGLTTWHVRALEDGLTLWDVVDGLTIWHVRGLWWME